MQTPAAPSLQRPDPRPHSLLGAGLLADELLDALPWGVLVLDEQHMVRRVNQQAARWCGARPTALLGCSLAEAAMPPALRVALLQVVLEPTNAAPLEVWLPEQTQWVAFSAARQPAGWVLYGQASAAQPPRLAEEMEPQFAHTVAALRSGEADTTLAIAREIRELKQAEAAALRQHDELAQHAADKYHALFYAMNQGFCVLEILFDSTSQQAVDYRYLELNPAFAQQSGMSADVLGKTVREVIPDLEPFWFDIYGRVAHTGETVRVEHYVPQVSRWFDTHAFRMGVPEACQVAVLFSDITSRKNAEAALRRAAEVDMFRLQLAEALGPLTDASSTQEAVMRLARQHFGADRCYYCEIEAGQALVRYDSATAGLPSVAGIYPMVGYTLLRGALDAGQPFSVHDVRHDEAVDEDLRQSCLQLQISAYLAVPVLKKGQLVGILCLMQSAPREWAAPDVALAAEVAERTWAVVAQSRAQEALRVQAARYRADLERQVQERTAELQQSRDLLQATMDSAVDMIQVFEAVRDETGQIIDFRWLLNNHTAERSYGEVRGQSLLERNPGVVPEGIFADFQQVVETGEPKQTERHYAHEQFDGWYFQSIVKLGDGVATSIKDITDWKKAQAELLRLRLSRQQGLFEAVQAAQEAERRRIAEGLHNGIGQLLYATKLRLDQLRPFPATAPPEWRLAHREANQLLSEAIHQTRALSHELVPLVLEEFGLVAALQDIGSQLSSPRLRLHCQAQLDAEDAPLSAALQLALYRMAQELAQNVVKHALGATEASLELETMPGWVLLRVEDNGPGFATLPPAEAGLGLRSIRDQVALLGGQLKTGTVPAGGAYVRIRIPYPAPAAA